MKQVGRPREFHEEEVLDRGIDYFRTHGFEGGGLCGLLEYTGLSRQSLYNSFGDKQTFFNKCLVRYREVWGERLFGKLQDANAGLRELQEVLLSLVDFLCEQPDQNCLLVKSTMELGASEEVVMEQIRVHTKYIEKGVRNVLKNEGTGTRGRISRGSGEETKAAQVLSLIFGLHVMARSRMSADRMKAAVRGTIDSMRC